ncbi:MAG: MbnH family di-heme enzyme [Myxococcota bacterium]
MSRRILCAACVATILGCGSEEEQTSPASAADVELRTLLGVPEHFQLPWIPSDNPPTAARIELGRHLFYDERLSGNQTQSCGSCHEQALAFADGKQRPQGSTGVLHPRNSQGLANAAYFTTLTWANDGLRTLEEQIRVPLLSDRPIELGLVDGVREEALARLEADPVTFARFEEAFPNAGGGVTLNKVILALSSFVRSMISGSSRFDRYVQGDTEALTPQERDGLVLFGGERFECFHCHGGILMSVSYRDANNPDPNPIFFNNGLYNVDGQGAYPESGQGLIELTGDPSDMGAFRPPSLRNIELTAPYMHDGSFETLRDVLEHYAAGGTNRTEGPHAGDGRLNPFKSNFVRGFNATEEELDSVEAFLRSLTDEEFVSDPRFSDPEEE